MKKRFLIILLVLAMIGGGLINPSRIFAGEEESVYSGLYLVKGENLKVNAVEININVNNEKTSKVTADYNITNTGEETTYITMGVPVAGLQMTDVVFRFTPYVYNSVVVAGEKINHLIDELALDYPSWRTFSFEIPLKAGETKTASVSYTIQNNYFEEGRIGFFVDMDHIKTWGERPDNITISAYFDPKTVKIYNFDNSYAISPTEMTPQYTLIWKYGKKDDIKDVSFNYFSVDEKLAADIRNAKSSQINEMLNSYANRDYASVIAYGKTYIQNSGANDYQNKVYLFMADAYIQLKEYDQALTLYELIESSTNNFGAIEKRIENKMLMNKVIAYEKLEKYEEMYDLIIFEQTDPELNNYMKQWLDTKLQNIPDDKLAKIMEDRKPPTAVEMFFKRFVEGNFTVMMAVGAAILALVVFIIIYIRRKRKNNFFY
ncbi:MAG: hypothetical protein HGA49_06940 [Eubacteriaceae bacterium]|nr:hypothetical protein [Eubacteriaceae bacterium]